jgi:hypothetical protein
MSNHINVMKQQQANRCTFKTTETTDKRQNTKDKDKQTKERTKIGSEATIIPQHEKQQRCYPLRIPYQNTIVTPPPY